MRLLKLLTVLALCLCLSVVVSAHPGGTDSSGGHTDHSTGGYHYHHGYSAHRHYDMDGDGDLDCPYLFDDKTGSPGNKTEATKETTKKGNALIWVDTICAVAVIFFLPYFLANAIKKRSKK